MTTIGVSVPVPEPFGSELQRQRTSFGDEQAANIPTHVTLMPPVEVSDEEFTGFEQHLEHVAAAQEPFELHLRGTATFRPVSPVVFISVVAGIAQCESLAAAVTSGPLGVETSFPYHPHVTIAHHLPDAALDIAFDTLADFQARMWVNRFALYEHGSDGVWRPQRHFVLGDPWRARPAE